MPCQACVRRNEGSASCLRSIYRSETRHLLVKNDTWWRIEVTDPGRALEHRIGIDISASWRRKYWNWHSSRAFRDQAAAPANGRHASASTSHSRPAPFNASFMRSASTIWPGNFVADNLRLFDWRVETRFPRFCSSRGWCTVNLRLRNSHGA